MTPAVKAHVTRLLACLAGGVVLAMMVGNVEGSSLTDYGFVFHQQVLAARIWIFLGIGVLAYLAITFQPVVRRYLTRPGAWPLISGLLAVIVATALMHWNDNVGDAKFAAVANAVANTPSISPIASAYFEWLAWTGLAVVFVLGALFISLQMPGWIAGLDAVLAVVMAVLGIVAHNAVAAKSGLADHSLGYLAAVLGYLVIAGAVLIAAVSGLDLTRSRRVAAFVLGSKPGLPLAMVGGVLVLISFLAATWFSPQVENATFTDTHRIFQGTPLAPIAVQYLIWLGWLLFVAALATAVLATWTANRWAGWAAVVVGVVGVVLTLVTLYDISALAAELKADGGVATGPWQNLGVGGWLACFGLFLLAGAGVIVIRRPSARHALVSSDSELPAEDAAARAGDSTSAAAPASGPRWLAGVAVPSSFTGIRGMTLTLLAIAAAAALFYPPMATSFWQQVLVTEMGIYMLLAVGLNVVVGWAGLLDLGFIAFYAIGSYVTAYLVGSLPIKPPSWLHLSPLWAIPFALVVCLAAGLLLGAPTLRLRGDYLAIVTLGFGEIIRLLAVNFTGVTNGSQGPQPAVPHPVIHIGPLHIRWGLDPLQYWYLLLVLTIIIVVLFRRLENSRLGRAWAAVREDEVAAQATGINTTRVKLMAFAIGASTSGVAGVFYASQIGSFTPDNFVLNNSILVVAYVVFGGMGSLQGAIAGAAMLTWLPEFLRDQVPPADRLMWIGAIVLLMMIFRPAGLLPAKRRKAELSHLGGSASPESRVVPAGEGL